MNMNIPTAIEHGTQAGKTFTFGEMIADVKSDLSALAQMNRAALQQLWAMIRARSDLPVIPAAWLEDGANGTGYFDDICEMGTQIPLGVFYKGADRHGRMVVVCRPMSGASEVICFFDRYRPVAGELGVICQQRRGGGASVDCNGYESVRMYADLAEALAGSEFSNHRAAA